MIVKPGEGITPNVEIQYKICNSVVNPAASIGFRKWHIPKRNNKSVRTQ